MPKSQRFAAEPDGRGERLKSEDDRCVWDRVGGEDAVEGEGRGWGEAEIDLVEGLLV